MSNAIKLCPSGVSPTAEEFIDSSLGLLSFEAIIFNDPTDVDILEVDVRGTCERLSNCLHINVGEIKHRKELQEGFYQLALRLAAIGEASRVIALGEGATAHTAHLAGDLYVARESGLSDVVIEQQKKLALDKVKVTGHDCQLYVRLISA